MKYTIEIIQNGVLITSTKESDNLNLKAPLTIFCKTIFIAADVLTTWKVYGLTKALTRAQKLNIESSWKE